MATISQTNYLQNKRPDVFITTNEYELILSGADSKVKCALFDFLQFLPKQNTFFKKKFFLSKRMLPFIIGKKQNFLKTITETTGVKMHEILDDGIVIFGRKETMAFKIIEKKHSEVGRGVGFHVSTSNRMDEPQSQPDGDKSSTRILDNLKAVNK
jgi:hypothetical protein